MNVTDDMILFLGNAQLDCVYTTQSKSSMSLVLIFLPSFSVKLFSLSLLMTF